MSVKQGHYSVAVISVKLSLAGVAISIIFVATKQVFCRDKTGFFVATKLCDKKNMCVKQGHNYVAVIPVK